MQVTPLMHSPLSAPARTHVHAHKEAVNTKSVERVSLKDVNFEEEEEDVFIINLHFSICQ